MSMSDKDPNTDTEISLWLGEVLQPDKNKHNEDGYKANACVTFCTKCKLELYAFAVPKVRDTMHRSRPCKYADPIPLTPAEAFKWRDWAVKEYGIRTLREALYSIYVQSEPYPGGNFREWVIRAKPKHFLIAAATLKENSK
jgi:hypothetical protein